MKYDLNNMTVIVNGVIASSHKFYYFALVSGILSLVWLGTAKKFHKNHYQRLVNMGGIYAVSFLLVWYVLPKLIKN
jgi:hypothetical protein